MNANNNSVWLPYTQMQTVTEPLMVSKTQGSKITLKNGQVLIDGIASWWTACHGYNHPHIVNAINKQSQIMPHIMLGGLIHEPVLELAERLKILLPGELNHCFFSESGSVSVEIALKIAVQYWLNLGHENKKRFICFQNGYHGDTMAAMSVCDPEEGMHAMFKDYLPEQIVLKLPETKQDLEHFQQILEQNINNLAGVILEPLVQGAGGMKFHSTDILFSIYNTCKNLNILLITDEIFTGFGRLGKLFACEYANIKPDLICLSKALTGGTLPLATTVATEQVFSAFLDQNPEKALMHGPTYMGNPICCAAANACLELFDQKNNNWQQQILNINNNLQKALSPLKNISGVLDVRIMGALGVVQLKNIDHNWFKQEFLKRNIWLRPFGDIVYTTPALSINKKELAAITQAMVELVKEWCSKND